jgi:hypothetical protein
MFLVILRNFTLLNTGGGAGLLHCVGSRSRVRSIETGRLTPGLYHCPCPCPCPGAVQCQWPLQLPHLSDSFERRFQSTTLRAGGVDLCVSETRKMGPWTATL